MESVRTARNRMKEAPALLVQCKTPGLVYATCVIRNHEAGHLKLNVCANEFEQFRQCLSKVALRVK